MQRTASISSTLIVRIFHTNVRFGSFYYVHVTRKAAKMTFVRKTRTFNVDEIDGCIQAYHFARSLLHDRWTEKRMQAHEKGGI